jgi:hypothetical protein
MIFMKLFSGPKVLRLAEGLWEEKTRRGVPEEAGAAAGW